MRFRLVAIILVSVACYRATATTREPLRSAPEVARAAHDARCARQYARLAKESDVPLEHGAEPMATNPLPDIHASTLEAFSSATIVVRFVVDTLGTVDMRTFSVVRSDHGELSNAVRRAIADWRFYPAEITVGCKVRQLFVQTMIFHGTGAERATVGTRAT